MSNFGRGESYERQAAAPTIAATRLNRWRVTDGVPRGGFPTIEGMAVPCDCGYPLMDETEHCPRCAAGSSWRVVVA